MYETLEEPPTKSGAGSVMGDYQARFCERLGVKRKSTRPHPANNKYLKARSVFPFVGFGIFNHQFQLMFFTRGYLFIKMVGNGVAFCIILKQYPRVVDKAIACFYTREVVGNFKPNPVFLGKCILFRKA